MNSRGLQFGWRITFVNRWTIRLLGKAKPGKTFASSRCEIGKRRNDIVCAQTSDVTFQNRTELEAAGNELSKKVESLTKNLQSSHKEILPLQLNRMEAARKVRRRDKLLSWDQGSEYDELKRIRKEASAKQLEIMNLKKALTKAKVSLYAINKTLKARPATTITATSTANPVPKVIKRNSQKRKIIFAGTDPGIVTTVTTILKTLEEVCDDIDRFQALSSTDGFDKQFSVKQLPRCTKITSGLIDSVTFLKHHQKKDQRRQASGVDAAIRQKKLSKERREREIRTQRAYGKIIGQERRRIRAYSQPSIGEPLPAIIHCFGHWNSAGSTIKGHSRRGTKKIIEQYRNYGYIEFTNEYKTSKICPYCFSEIVLHQTRRIVNGIEKIVRLNGAVECIHPQCPAKNIGYTTRGRDTNAAANIALSGASGILAVDRQPLPCYRRDAKQPRYILDANLLYGRDTEMVHHDFILKE